MLIDKYAPTTLNQIVGNHDVVDRLLAFGSAAQSGKQKPIMLFGPPGVGKTCSAHALAASNGFELLSLDASDYRDAESLRKTLLPAVNSSRLFGGKLLILLDEIDELSTKFDGNAEKVILDVLEKTKYPVVFIANDYWNKKIAFLRDKVEKFEFKRVDNGELTAFLTSIAEKEGKKVEKEIIENIAMRSNGDVRCAMNDLDVMFDASPELLSSLGIRNRKAEIFGVLDKIFLYSNFDTARSASISSDLDTSMLMNWIEQNVPTRYNGKKERLDAYDNLARASFFLHNAQRNNHYSYLRYSSILMTSGVALSARGNVSYSSSYSFPEVIRQLASSKKGRVVVSNITTKLIYCVHTHKKNIYSEYFHLFRAMIADADKKGTREELNAMFQRTYGLTPDEIKAIA